MCVFSSRIISVSFLIRRATGLGCPVINERFLIKACAYGVLSNGKFNCNWENRH